MRGTAELKVDLIKNWLLLSLSLYCGGEPAGFASRAFIRCDNLIVLRVWEKGGQTSVLPPNFCLRIRTQYASNLIANIVNVVA